MLDYVRVINFGTINILININYFCSRSCLWHVVKEKRGLLSKLVHCQLARCNKLL